MFLRKIDKRIKIIFLILLVLFIFIILRVFYIQMIDYKKLNDYASNLWSRDLPIEADRGLILDRNGVVLADNLTTTSLVLIPNQIKNKKKVTNQLAEILGVSYDEMEEHLVMMNLLIDRYYQPLLQYKYNLLYYIIDRQDLSLEIYCLLRHLIQFKYGKLEEFIKGITVYKNISEYEYHHIASEIFLLEKQYRRAYQHLPYVEYDQSLQRFENALYNYSPRQFFQLLNIDHQQVQLLSFR